ncbi:MAG: GSCFA domain-containing protein, partial [Prevotella sp.]|nr:GSCFA domain-containing protein [Prevotella sp.]
IVGRLTDSNPQIRILLTVSPIRYAKYGYHESNLSKATLLLACQQVAEQNPDHVTYFPAYEIMNDELRDYRFYATDMLHPSEQGVEYIWERLSEQFFSAATQQFLQEWRPIRQALNHRPFNPDSDDYLAFLQKTRQRVEQLSQKYPAFSLSEEENKRLERNTI